VRTVDVPRLGQPVVPLRIEYAWSRDGTRVAFAVGDSIYAYSPDNPEPQLLGVHTVDTWRPHSLVWSPDGRWLAYVNSNPHWRSSANVAHSSIWMLSTAGGEPVSVTDEEHLNVSPQWLPDSRHLLFVSDRDGSRGIHLVEVGPEGARSPPRSVLPSSDPHSISVSADGRRLAYAKFTVRQNVWSIPWPRSGPISIRDDLGTAVPVTTGNQVIESFNLSPDGEWIAFDSYVRGEFDIYKQRLAGGDPQLVVDMMGNAYGPKWSPDGTELAFHGPLSMEGGGGGEVFVVSADGGTPVQLTEFPGQDSHADWSPDGLSIAFNSKQGTLWSSWVVSRISADMPWADPVRLTDFECAAADWAPDGRSLVCRPARSAGYGIGLVRVSRDGEVLAHLTRPAGMAGQYFPRYSQDGSQIYFRGTHEDGTEGIWSMPADGGDATLVVAFDDPSVTVFGDDMGLDNFYFAYSEYESDIWVMDLDW